jgi:CDP-paratose 2-epimerase
MSMAIVTGSGGLIGSETARFLTARGLEVTGIDNDMRARFFGPEASTSTCQERLIRELKGYRHLDADIRDLDALRRLFEAGGRAISLIVHTAAQPSHDWAARDPFTDFGVNANGTLNLLELARQHCPEAVFIFTSTNKVYGDRPNGLPLVEGAKRWEIAEDHPYHRFGIDEAMPIDATLHSLFGASKVAADVLVQEYGRYFGMATACFRGGCLTGPGHAGAELHGFLAYLMKCAATGTPYRVLGYGGKQVRDNIHSADLVEAFWQFFERPRAGAVYNIGGGREVNCSMLEAIDLCEEIAGRPLDWSYSEQNRTGDHVWWISDTRCFEQDYPAWRRRHGLRAILEQIHGHLQDAHPQSRAGR